ncbi:MAG: glycosyltransferase family 39 protein [Phycisphaerales bacterium]|nr:glycosyltransferase family 39 protein [Phycisphaerales bacterium]
MRETVEGELAAETTSTRRPRTGWCLLVIVLFGCAAYLPAINWGLPALNSWSQDTIAGPNRTFVVEGWPQDWRGRYPPLHYLLNAGVYRAIETVWRWRGELSIDPATGLKVLAEPQLPKLGFLILASNLLTFLMAIGTGAAVFCTALRLTSDRLSALLAALVLLSGADFACFARLGNVDVPSIFWMAWSAYFYVRLTDSRRLWDAVMLALFAAAAVCTKDGVAGVYPGMAVVLLAIEALRCRRESQERAAEAGGVGGARPVWWVRTLCQPRWFIGLGVFVMVTLYFNGALHNWDRFAARMHYWLDATADTLHAQQPRYANPLHLALVALRYAGGAVGWPMLAAMLAACAVASFRHRRLAVLTLLPAATYYFMVIECGLEFVYSRFLFPMLALAAIPTGWAAAAFLRSLRVPAFVKGLAAVVVGLPTAGYLASVSFEMMTDSRYLAESWLRDRVPAGSPIGVFCKPQYLPRLIEMGYDVYSLEMTAESIAAHPCAALVLSSYDFRGYAGANRDTFETLVHGEGGYDVAAQLGGLRYLGTGNSWLSLAGWGAEPPGKISPEIIVLTHTRERDVEGISDGAALKGRLP